MKRFRAIIAIIIVLISMSAAMTMAYTAYANTAIPGDVNGDGKVNIRDSATILLYVDGKPVELVNDVADVNGDGVIDILDAEYLLEYITDSTNIELSTGDICEHELIKRDSIRVTCTSAGRIEHWVCSICSKLFKDEKGTTLITEAVTVVAQLGDHHTEVIDPAVAATCTTEGKTEGKHCSVCNEVIVAQTVVAAKGHTESDWIVDKVATSTEEGSKHTECTVCNMVLKTQSIPATISLGLEFTLNSDNESYSVTGIGTCTDTEIVIPAVYNGKPVTSIGERAFNDCFELIGITIPDSVTNIDKFAFYFCTNLTSVTIGNGVTTIDVRAFSDCYSLTNINIPDSVTKIGNYAFSNCIKLVSINIPKSVTSIRTAILSGCSGLTSITVDKDNPVYHSEGNCVIETESKTLVAGCNNSIIPSDGSVTSIKNYAFYDCTELTSITIPNIITKIGYGAFARCYKLESISVENGNSVYHSEGNCLIETASKTLIAGCKNSVIPADGSVTKIEQQAFEGCTGLTSIIIPNSVTSVESQAFSNCTGLTSITIPNSVTRIEQYAFNNCKALNTFFFDGTVAEWEAVTKVENWNFGCSFTVLFPSEGLTYELNADGTAYKVTGIGTCMDTDIVIPNTYNGLPVTEIADSAFKGTNITSVIIPYSIATINDYAFASCPALQSITVDPGNNVFYSANNCVVEIATKTIVAGCNASVIPSDGSVTGIGRYSFFGCDAFVDLVIPEGIESIGPGAFRSCPNLTSITIPASVTSIGIHSIAGCTKLEIITVAEENTVYHSVGNCLIETAAKKLISGCKTSVIPTDGSVEIIGTRAFREIATLTSIVIPESVTTIDSYAFVYCTGLESIVIPAGVTSIGEFAFHGCAALKSVTLPESLTTLGKSAFRECVALESINIPSGITSIGNYAFYGCTSLTSATIGNSVTSIGDHAFAYCTNLTSAIIPDGVTDIGGWAFYTCKSITELVLPSSVTSIGRRAFAYCSSLETFIFNGTASEWEAVTLEEEWNYSSSFTVIFTSQGLAYELNADGTAYTVTGIGTCTDTDIIIPSNYNGLPVTSIGNSAFYQCSSLTSVTIPDSVTSIDNNAFRECINLTSAVIGNGVTSINYCAFYFCSNLTSITIPNSVTNIGDYAFADCRILTSITIPNGVTSIGERAFAYCTALNTFIFDGTEEEWEAVTKEEDWNENCTFTVTFISQGLAYELNKEGTAYSVTGIGTCTDTDLVIPNTYNGLPVTEIADSAFKDTAITSVIVLDGIKKINNYAFSECSKLVSVILPNSITSMGLSTFSDCRKLENVNIPSNVTSIGYNVFYNCQKLSNIIIPEGVKTIADQAFSYCSNLTNITLPESVTSIGERAFRSCSNLSSINIPESVASIGFGAFTQCDNLAINISPNNTHYALVNNCLIEIESKTLIVGLNDFIIPTDGSVTVIGDMAFFGCREVTNIILPESITEIGEFAFASCSNLISITIPNSLTNIGQRAFQYCTKLTSITIPNSVTNIDISAFNYCTSLNTFIFNGTAEEWEAVTKGEDWNENCTFTVTFPSEGLAYGLNADGTAYTVTGIGTCTDTDVVIPAVYNGNPVTRIGRDAFNNCNNLTSVTILGNITSIGFNAFYYCENLASINIPDSVTSIASQAFIGCKSLTSINIPYGVTSIGEMAFCGCDSLTSIIIPDSVSYIDSYAFQYCSNLTSITIPDSVTSIGKAAFRGCPNLVNINISPNNTYYSFVNNCLIEIASKTLIAGFDNSVIPTDGSVTVIGDSAFYDCAEITRITIPDNITSISDYAFSGCKNLESIIIPSGVTSIGEYAFSDCRKLKTFIFNGTASEWEAVTKGENWNSGCSFTVTFPSEGLAYELNADGTAYTVTGIGTCTDTEVVIPNVYNSKPVIGIGYYAFSECINLTSISVPDSVRFIGGYAFYKCSKLKSINIPNSVISIGLYAFDSCKSLTSVTLPSSVTTIGQCAFRECSALESINIPDGVTSIGNATFFNCDQLTSITIPSSVTSIGRRAFAYCSSLETFIFNGTASEWEAVTLEDEWNYSSSFTVVFPSEGLAYELNADGTAYTVTGIGTCTDTEVVIPAVYEGKPVTRIGFNAFDGCTSLTSVTIPNSVTSIDIQAFMNCTILTSVIIPDSVRSIGDGAFRACSALESINIPDGLTSIGSHAFRGCQNLESINISESVTSIGYGAFADCDNIVINISSNNTYYALVNNCLIEIESKTLIAGFDDSIIPIDGSVTVIDSHAFYKCDKITSITIPDSITSIGSHAFYGCSSLITVNIPDCVTSIGDYAFGRCTCLNDVYYTGTDTEWNAISIGSDNANLTDAKRYYYSETEPTVEGNFWHYVDGVPTVWTSGEEIITKPIEFADLSAAEQAALKAVMPVSLPDSSQYEIATRIMSFDRGADDYIIQGNSQGSAKFVGETEGAVYGQGIKFAAINDKGTSRAEIELIPLGDAVINDVKGVMFYVDFSNVLVNPMQPMCASVTINTNDYRSKGPNNGNGDGSAIGYYYIANTWVQTSNVSACRMEIPANFAGWIYVPATSFYDRINQKGVGETFDDIFVMNMRCYTDGYIYSADNYIIFDEIVFVK